MIHHKPTWLGAIGVVALLPSVTLADVSGKVFRDFNANGVFDASTTSTEFGMAGITVKAFDVTGAETASAISGADGSYTLTGLTAAADYRVEFSWVESWLKPGASGGTSVQFAKDGASDVNLAVNNPAQYCQADPLISTTHFWPLEQTTTNPTLVGFPYSGGVTAPSGAAYELSSWQDAVPKTFGKSNELGAIFGIAWQRSQQYIYSAALKEQYVGFGPGGRGQIYRTKINPVDGSVVSAPEKWVNVETDLGLSVCGSHDNLAAAGYSDAEFDQVGKCSLGDLEISENEQSLFVSNLTTKQIVEISTANGNKLNTFDFPLNAADCPNNTTASIRPFGLAYQDGKLFAGAVCSAEESQNVNDIRAFVYRLDDPATQSWTRVAHFNPSVVREDPFNNPSSWKPWRNAWSDAGGYYQGYESPILSDIAFYDNNMVLGLRDRTGDQIARGIIINGTTINGVASLGDIVCTSYDVSTQTYLPETSSPNACGTRVASGTGKGDKNGEFYWGDGNAAATTHSEITMGNLAVFGGSNLLVGGVNPGYALGTATSESGGILWLNNETGAAQKTYYLYTGTGNNNSKGNGMGDLEALCDPAPVEIGNRVWRDTDGDGIQDADEASIDGVDVVLTCGTDTATATTANGGQFLFSSATNASFMSAGESCQLKVSSAGQAALDGLSVTQQNADSASDNHPVTDVRDSDANSSGEISFTVGNSGENNHALDFGFKSASVITFDPPPGPDAFSCAANVRLATSVQVNGDSQAAGSTGAGVDGLITFDYAATGELAAPFSKATAGQVGSVWGLSYDVSRKKLYAAAFLKRHASFGPNGIGAIYQMDGTSATPTPGLLMDLAAKGVDVGTSPRVAASGVMDDPNELPIDASKPSWDRDAFAQVGKISLGDIDISADGNTLWAVNLKQRELVEIDLTNTTVKAKHAITDPGCSNGEFRPWAVKVHDGKVWVGTVCSAETSQQAADLKAYVQAFDGTTFTTATSFALNYSKGSIGNGPGDEKWQPWKDTFTTLASGDFAIYPQPILSDIEFDMDGSLILGFMDRLGHQVGGVNYTPNYPDDDTMIQGQTGGDIIRVCNNGGKYELENNATCTSGSTAGKDKGQGPGNGEYYWGEMWDFNPFNADGGYHQETSFGGLAFKAGSGEIAVTAMNPLNPNANAGGVIWLDNATGGRAANAGVQVYRQQDGTSPYFGKASGVGDVELFCAEAALQPDLSLTKDVKPNAKRGETVIYTLTLSNTGTGAATGVSVTDSLPAGVVYVSDDGVGAYVASSGVWSVGSLAANTTKTLKITVTVK